MNDDVLIQVYGQMLRTRGCSVDKLLCDPEERKEFLTEVRRRLPKSRKVTSFNESSI